MTALQYCTLMGRSVSSSVTDGQEIKWESQSFPKVILNNATRTLLKQTKGYYCYCHCYYLLLLTVLQYFQMGKYCSLLHVLVKFVCSGFRCRRDIYGKGDVITMWAIGCSDYATPWMVTKPNLRQVYLNNFGRIGLQSVIKKVPIFYINSSDLINKKRRMLRCFRNH